MDARKIFRKRCLTGVARVTFVSYNIRNGWELVPANIEGHKMNAIQTQLFAPAELNAADLAMIDTMQRTSQRALNLHECDKFTLAWAAATECAGIRAACYKLHSAGVVSDNGDATVAQVYADLLSALTEVF